MAETITAIVSGLGTAAGVARYLPGGWEVVIAAEGNQRVLALIKGPRENGGWGFENYVQPRLGSGNYGVFEVDPDAGYVAVSGARAIARRELQTEEA
jgi:hypothetical protein